VPIWTRKPEDVTKEEYATFYKSTYADWEDPLAIKHFSAEGQVEFKALLYIPPRAPFDMFTGGVSKKLNNVKMYVRKVLIMEESNEILPEYLSFIKGIVDSDDLPLNVSREMLQKNNIMKVIQKSLVKKCIDLVTELSTEDEDKWKKFYAAFSKNLKLGVMEDGKSREKLKELLRFNTSKGSEDDMISLKDYVTRMKEDQKAIYYVTAESFVIANNLPCIEKLRKKGYEVIFMVDPIDEYLAPHLTEYDGKTLVNCSRDGFTLDGDDTTKTKEEWTDTCKAIQELLKDKIKEVKVSERLVKRPCVVVSDQYGWTANMERIMKAQALRSGNDAFSYMSTMKKTMEINPDHAILKLLKDRIAEGIAGSVKDIEGPVKGIVDTLYETAMVDSGYSMEDPAKYCTKIYRLIELGLGGGDGEEEAGEAGAEEGAAAEPVSSLEEVD
jgi:molecular chaperone HtpG